MAYTSGNLALKPKPKQEQPKKQPQYRETKRTVIKKKAIPVKEKLLYLFTVIPCVIIAGIIIFRYAQIYDLSMNTKQLNSQYQTMIVEMEDMKKQVEMLNDPERIREIAETQGMTINMESSISVKKSGTPTNSN
ncbi:cell division protein FtsL [Paenibacillus yanchengensis]|uniref:Cell division protein FtsL n=1 Tax=Paenibacillus yanchengensis TaxID=2035833 RepID=A0ABW4YKQ4_9BACL